MCGQRVYLTLPVDNSIIIGIAAMSSKNISSAEGGTVQFTLSSLLNARVTYHVDIVTIVSKQYIGGASAASAATVRSSKSRFAIDICLVRANHTGHA